MIELRDRREQRQPPHVRHAQADGTDREAFPSGEALVWFAASIRRRPEPLAQAVDRCRLRGPRCCEQAAVEAVESTAGREEAEAAAVANDDAGGTLSGLNDVGRGHERLLPPV